MEKYDAIYARQSVDKVDSISIESQVEFCKYETRGGAYKTFADKGYSGKNLARPNFQEMLNAIRRGEVKRVIAYKLDRISRSILDFANLMEELQNYKVEFVSCTEKFDTSTPMGRAMLNICIVFAQLERETIQQRVTDAYTARSRRGFYMGGRVPYGFIKEDHIIDGKRTSKYAPNEKELQAILAGYLEYQNPYTPASEIVDIYNSFGLVNKYARDHKWSRSHIVGLMKNPIYAKADLQLYEFFKSQGAIIHNPPEDFIGTNGCYLYAEKGIQRKEHSLEGHHIVIAPHKGIVPSDVWIKVREKLLKHSQVAKPTAAKNSWLLGKVKCKKCGYGMCIRKSKRVKSDWVRYFVCSRKDEQACDGVGGFRAADIEDTVLEQMKIKLLSLGSLKSEERQIDPRINDLRILLTKVDSEIEQLMEKVLLADEVLIGYINKKISELDAQRTEYQEELKKLEYEATKEQLDVIQISDCIQKWETISFNDKRTVCDALIDTIFLSQNTVEILWKF